MKCHARSLTKREILFVEGEGGNECERPSWIQSWGKGEKRKEGGGTECSRKKGKKGGEKG